MAELSFSLNLGQLFSQTKNQHSRRITGSEFPKVCSPEPTRVWRAAESWVPPSPTKSDTQGYGPGISFLANPLRNSSQVQESLTCAMRGSLLNSTTSGVGAELGELITLKCLLQCATMFGHPPAYLMSLALGLSHSHLLKGLKRKVLGILAYRKNQQVRVR